MVLVGALTLAHGCGGTTRSETGSHVGDDSDGGGGDDGSDCPIELQRKAEAYEDVAWALSAVVPSLASDLAQACAQILAGLGVPDAPVIDPEGPVSDEQLMQVCGAMRSAIEDFVSAGCIVDVVGRSGECQLAARSQLDCEADCDVVGDCDPGTVEERCPPDGLVAPCAGECDGDLVCQPDAASPIDCNGECTGTCAGDCDADCHGECIGTCAFPTPTGECVGQCDGDCTGACTGTCSGTCDAQCVALADSAADCETTRICRGVCLDGAEAANCTDELEPPSCPLDEDCAVACAAFGALGALCTPPRFVVAGIEPAMAQSVAENVEEASRRCQQAALVALASSEAVGRMEGLVAELAQHELCEEQATNLQSLLGAAASHASTTRVVVETCYEVSGLGAPVI